MLDVLGPVQQGIHNAMRLLLVDVLNAKHGELPGYESVKASDNKPALWITSVGRESFVPVAALAMVSIGQDSESPLVPCPIFQEAFTTILVAGAVRILSRPGSFGRINTHTLRQTFDKYSWKISMALLQVW
jgi:hypothetical protein